jgi:Zn-dependent M28 family amino/carboxypeptidase
MGLLQVIQELEMLSDQQRFRRVREYLNEWEVDHRIQRYGSGNNIWVPSQKRPYVGISSHFDTVPLSPGANDNASALAVSLALLQRYIARPFKRIGLQFFFFDEEEKGLLGSKAFVEAENTYGMMGLINMELVGSGNQFALWPLDASSESKVLEAIEIAGRKLQVPTHRIGSLIMHSADHLPFRQEGLGDAAFTISCISGQDVAVAEHYFKAQSFDVSEETLIEIAQQAPIFEHYHQPSDLSIHLEESSLQQCTDLIWTALEWLESQL